MRLGITGEITLMAETENATIFIKTFDGFDVYVNGKMVYFPSSKAKEMLAEAGFPAGQTLKFFISSGSSITERCAALIVQDFANVGVNVEIEQMDFATLMSRMLDGEHDLGIIGSGGTLDPSESREMI